MWQQLWQLCQHSSQACTQLHVDGNIICYICGERKAHALTVALAHWTHMQDLRMPTCDQDVQHAVSQAGTDHDHVHCQRGCRLLGETAVILCDST